MSTPPPNDDPAIAPVNYSGELDARNRRARVAAQGGPLTVLQVAPELNVGGVERAVLEMASAVHAAGGRALVASAGGRMENRLKLLGGELIRLPLDSKNIAVMRRNAVALRRVIEREKVDLVHARSRAPAWSAWWAARRGGASFITTYHGIYRENAPLKRRYNAVMAKGRPTIAVSNYVAELIRARHHIPAEDIVVIARGADLSMFSPAAVSAERVLALGEKWGVIDDPRPIILLPGRVTRWKGHEDFIDAAAMLRVARGAADFLCVIAGGDGGSGFACDLERRIAKAGLTDCVHLVGHTEDMAAAYKLSAAVVSASIEPEAFGRIAIEAQAMGDPVIATDHGGACETVAPGETGWLYRPGDAAALAALMEGALDLSPARREAMSAAAAERIAARFSTTRLQCATLDVYERATGKLFARRV